MTSTANSSAALRVVVAGLGFGARVHVPALRGLPGVTVIGIAGSSEEHARQVGDDLAIPFACAGVSPLLELEPDLVTLALPPRVNEEALALVLAAGVPVITEKPLAASLPAARSLDAAASNVHAAIDFEFAELAAFRSLKDIVDHSTLGSPRHLSITWLTKSTATERWKNDHDRGGGVLSLLGSHVLYLIEWLLGPVDVLTASLHQSGMAPQSDVQTHDTVRILARTASEVSVGGWISNSVSGARVHEWQLACERGTVTLANTDRDWAAGFELRVSGTRHVAVPHPAEPTESDGRIFAVRSLAARFIRDERSGDFRPSISDGLRVQQLMDAVEISAANAIWIAVPCR